MLQDISIVQLKKQHDSGERLEVIDVRTPAEFREIHLPFAKNVPLESFDPEEYVNQRCDASVPVVIICRTGRRATRACERLRQSGLENAFVLTGGIDRWVESGYEVVRGKKTISLERQVRITAGGMALVGTALGVFVHPWLLVIPAFVGAGLIFAGITDSCPMAMMIAKMPWNQGGEKCGGTCESRPASHVQSPHHRKTETNTEQSAWNKESVCG